MVFKIANTDYSSKVIVDTYEVNRIDVFTEWEDANGTTHRDVYRRRIEGQFDMQISDISEYNRFIADVHGYTQNGGWVPCRVSVNNYNQENMRADLFIDYAPIRTMKNDYTKGFMTFTVTVKER